MPGSLQIELNPRRLHEIEAPAHFEATGSFDVELTNRGESVHVHLNVDDSLSEAATLEAGNHYVEADATRTVRIDCGPLDEAVSGKLKIVTGYGAETAYVDVTFLPYDEVKPRVQVDERLGRPPQPDPEPDPIAERLGQFLPNSGTVPVVALGLFAVVLGVGTALSIDSPAVSAGLGAILVGVVVAAYLLVR